jgi:hypothetical protein
MFGQLLTWLLTPASPPWRNTASKGIESAIQLITAGGGVTCLCFAAKKLTNSGFNLHIASHLQLEVAGFLALPMLLMVFFFWTQSNLQTVISDIIDWLFRALACVLYLLLAAGLYYNSRFGLSSPAGYLYDASQLPSYARFWPTYLICVGFVAVPMVLRFWYKTTTRFRDCAIGAVLLFGTCIAGALFLMQPDPFWFPDS